MKIKTYGKEQNRWLISLGMITAGILLNLIPAKLVLLLKIPLFIDCLGTILVTMLGGPLPGVSVGFFSNVISGITDPITMYYSLISILIALAVSVLMYRGCFGNVKGLIISIITISLIGGGLGSVLTWLLYGFNFGSGISAPLVYKLYGTGLFSRFAAQLTGDMLIDLLDKIVVLVMASYFYAGLPKKWVEMLQPYSFSKDKKEDGGVSEFFRHSLLRKVITTMLVFELSLCVIVLIVCFFMYRDTVVQRYTSVAQQAANLETTIVDGNRIDLYLKEGEKADGYLRTKKRLEDIRDSFADLEYLYVYRYEEDGVHVVFDLDSIDQDGNLKLAGDSPGVVIDFDPSIEKLGLVSKFIEGQEAIEPYFTNDEDGELLIACKPIYDNSGKVQAYACADIQVSQIERDEEIFIVKVFTMLFGASLILIGLVLNYAQIRLVNPIKEMEAAASHFNYQKENGGYGSLERLKGLNINTGDELTSLYFSLAKLAEDATTYIEKTEENARMITTMQEGIIMDFANMVESRDKCTGDHIKKTSMYVDAIAQEMIREKIYPDQLNEEKANNMVKSAPLHDVGKIKISDTILNKPGKLTDEEFAIMKTHTTEGKNILSETIISTSGSGYLQDSIDMAYCHHERWDGYGYPQGLKGEEIPLSARIMAVADVFDALVSRRSYKDPFTYDKALDIISEESGTHFDPNVVDAFLNIAPSFREMIEEAQRKGREDAEKK